MSNKPASTPGRKRRGAIGSIAAVVGTLLFLVIILPGFALARVVGMFVEMCMGEDE